ncbi:MAG: efflux RND transporter periplasmic adaptor subunit, partial [Endomicrobiales bacterium]
SVENELRFEIEGVIASYNFREGDRIAKGKIICSLDPKDSFTKADFARSKYSSERSTYFSASQRLKVYEELFRMKAISESKLQESRFETQSAEARMKAALSELELAQSNLAKTNLLAPSDGMLAEILIKSGDYVTPQDVVAKFIRGGDTNFEVDVPEKDVGKLKVGMKVKINCDSYPGRDFFGTLSEIAPTVKERTRTTTIKVGIANEAGLLRSGMFGRGQIFVVELQDVMLVPSDSIVNLGDNTSLVPVVKPDPKIPGEGIIEMRQVKAGTKLSQNTVIDDGLFPEEMVVVETQGQLSDGLHVKFSEIVTKKAEGGPNSLESSLGSPGGL